MKVSTIALLTTLGIVGAGCGYLAYFDYKRRNDPKFRRKLKKDRKKALEKAREASKKTEATIEDKALELIDSLKDTKLPVSPQDKEKFFMSQISNGEILATKGPVEFDNAAKCFYQALKVYPNPIELIMIYQKTIPEQLFALIMAMMNSEVNVRKNKYYEIFPPPSMNVESLPSTKKTSESSLDSSATETDAKTDTKTGTKPEKKSKDEKDPVRGLFASKDFKKGDIICSESPLVAVIYPEYSNDHVCNHCFKFIKEDINISSISKDTTASSEIESEPTASEPQVDENQNKADQPIIVHDDTNTENQEQSSTQKTAESLIESVDSVEKSISESVVIVDEKLSISSDEKSEKLPLSNDSNTSNKVNASPVEATEESSDISEESEAVLENSDELITISEADPETPVLAEIKDNTEDSAEVKSETESASDSITNQNAESSENIVEEKISTLDNKEDSIDSAAVEKEKSANDELLKSLLSIVNKPDSSNTEKEQQIYTCTKCNSAVYCSKKCMESAWGCEHQYLCSPTENDESSKFAQHCKDISSLAPDFVAKLFGTIIEIERKKEMATLLGIAASDSITGYLYEAEGSSDYTAWEHLERLRDDPSISKDDDKLSLEKINSLLGNKVEGLADFISLDRYSDMKSKLLANSYAIQKKTSDAQINKFETFAKDKIRNQNSEDSMTVGYGLYLMSSYLLNSIDSNTSIQFLGDNFELSLVATKDINKGDELFANYEYV
ncbi:hypothetical protein BB561_006676 [Smittium simulii]|uniref:MYND-type domain-containing protein n=1 Tax=Smittium simulii TaxID=133385 RepID=A0A2T9Y2J3_9FUNG|nr:hypothetical protein BB561_006676 [Smittium simulii]